MVKWTRGAVEIFMKEYIAEIKEKTSGMSKKEVCIYVMEYYWYHILGITATIALVLLFVSHYASGNEKPAFTCVLINQETGIEEAQEMAKDFAISSGLPEKQVIISPDYTFSYGNVLLEGVNESSYEKFFFQLGNNEIDAIVMPESFYLYIREMGGMFQELDKKYGVELLEPCYKEYHLELGEISSYPPGFKENGSVFCHNNPWIVCGEAVLGRGNEAFDIYRRICPAYLEEKDSKVHETEPYVYAQTVTGRASGNPGHAKNSWLTGTASWAFVSASQAILGIQPDYDGLRIIPCIPDNWNEYTVYRRFRGTQYIIHILRTGEWSMAVNGKPERGHTVPLFSGHDTVQVEVTI